MTTQVSANVAQSFWGRKNAIINGDFNIWQRGTTFTSIASGVYSADRWVYSKAGAMVHDISRSTDVPTVAQAGRLFNYSLLVDCTTADAAIAAGDQCSVNQNIEGYNWLPLAQRQVTVSFWVKATITGVYCVALTNSGLDRSFVVEYTINAADTWELKTATFDASPSAGTWDYTTGVGARLIFSLAAGTDFQGAAGAWNSANDYATANQVNACNSTANNWRIVGVQLEPGSVATAFEQRTVQHELHLCKRYCQPMNFGYFGSTTNTFSEGDMDSFPVEMRAAPTAGTQTVIGTDTSFGGGAATIQNISSVGFNYLLNATGTGANGNWFRSCLFSAEL